MKDTLDWNPLEKDCPSREVLARIGDRWTILIIRALADGPLRYSELARSIDGISQKMLSQNLKLLTRDGLVSRKVYPEVPPRVEYELTDAGKTLGEPLQALLDWAVTHMDDIVAARQKYDIS